jgi:hypothetical protein
MTKNLKSRLRWGLLLAVLTMSASPAYSQVNDRVTTSRDADNNDGFDDWGLLGLIGLAGLLGRKRETVREHVPDHGRPEARARV